MKKVSIVIIGFLLGACLQAKNLTVFNIVPTFEKSTSELAEDIVRVEKERIANESLMIFTLVPEGNRPVDKLAVLEKRFKEIQRKIDGRARLGVLVQSSIGHAYPLKNPNNLEHMVRIHDLKTTPNKCCPLGEGVIKYMTDICRRIAMLKPTHIMIDDDFRMYTGRDQAGCLCDAHLERISKKLGYKITAKQAKAHLMGTSPEDYRIASIIDEEIVNSLCELAQKMRDAIDEVDPTIRGSISVCDADNRYAARLGKIFAGKNHKPIIRINNARYAEAGKSPRNFAITMYKSATQLAPLKDDAIVIAETDTLPHNRYGTSARTLHSNYCAYVFDGCQGSKQWITMTSEFDAKGGEAFRKILSEHADYYEAIYKTYTQIKKYSGFSTLIPDKPFRNLNPFNFDGYSSFAGATWAQSLCCVMGIPTNFVRVGKNAGMFGGEELIMFSDDEIKRQLARGVAVDGLSARILIARGFGKYLGVDVANADLRKINFEIISDDSLNGQLAGKTMVGAQGIVKLIPTSHKTRVLANFVHVPFGQDDIKNAKIISPSCTIFENELGGKVIVCASNIGGGGWGSYSRYPRKDFFLNVFNSVEPYKVWYPYDAEMYVKSATLNDGSEFVGLFNFGFDPLENIELATIQTPKSVKILQKNGEWKEVAFTFDNKILTIPTKLEPMYPAMLRIDFAK